MQFVRRLCVICWSVICGVNFFLIFQVSLRMNQRGICMCLYSLCNLYNVCVCIICVICLCIMCVFV